MKQKTASTLSANLPFQIFAAWFLLGGMVSVHAQNAIKKSTAVNPKATLDVCREVVKASILSNQDINQFAQKIVEPMLPASGKSASNKSSAPTSEKKADASAPYVFKEGALEIFNISGAAQGVADLPTVLGVMEKNLAPAVDGVRAARSTFPATEQGGKLANAPQVEAARLDVFYLVTEAAFAVAANPDGPAKIAQAAMPISWDKSKLATDENRKPGGDIPDLVVTQALVTVSLDISQNSPTTALKAACQAIMEGIAQTPAQANDAAGLTAEQVTGMKIKAAKFAIFDTIYTKYGYSLDAKDFNEDWPRTSGAEGEADKNIMADPVAGPLLKIADETMKSALPANLAASYQGIESVTAAGGDNPPSTPSSVSAPGGPSVSTGQAPGSFVPPNENRTASNNT